jgi:hypothetical protein
MCCIVLDDILQFFAALAVAFVMGTLVTTLYYI